MERSDSSRLAPTATVGVLALAAIAVAAVFALRGSGSPHVLRAVFARATNAIAGQDVRIAGVRIGEVTAVGVSRDNASLTLEIDTANAWPLTRGTVARIRFGTTVGAGGRYVELDPGPPGARPLSSGATLTPPQTVSPVEFGDLVNTFNGPARTATRATIRELGTALAGHGPALARGLDAAPPALQTTSDLLAQLGADPNALQTLVSAGAATASALASRDPQLQTTLSDAASTFAATGSQAQALQATLTRLPTALTIVRQGLTRTDNSLTILQRLLMQLRPGADELVKIAGPAQRAAAALNVAAPELSRALGVGTDAAPDITSFLRAGAPFVGRLRSVLSGVIPTLTCVRPYGPELAGFISNWAGFAKNYGPDGHVLNTLVIGAPIPTATPVASQAAVSLVPGLSFAYPQPPGLNATPPGDHSQVWLQPPCGEGASTLDPAQDPEARK